MKTTITTKKGLENSTLNKRKTTANSYKWIWVIGLMGSWVCIWQI
jgi:hypothetical protein